MPSRPTEHDVQLGDALKKVRLAAGLTQKATGGQLGKSQSWVHRIETGKQKAQPSELRSFVDLCHPSPEAREEIDRLTMPLAAGTPPGFPLNQHFMEMTRRAPEAGEILLLQSERLAMELQSDQYTLLQYAKAGDRTSPEDLLFEKRRRELVLTGQSRPVYRAILAQSSLERMPGGNSSLKKQQAEHLLGLLESCPTLSIQVLHDDADLAYLDVDMTILKFADKRPNVLYIPFGLDGLLLRDKAKVDERESYWRTVQAAALNDEDSRKFIHSLTQ